MILFLAPLSLNSLKDLGAIEVLQLLLIIKHPLILLGKTQLISVVDVALNFYTI